MHITKRRWPILFLFCMAAILVARCAVKSSKEPHQSLAVQTQVVSPVKASDIREAVMTADDWMAIFSGLLLLVTGAQLILGWRTGKHFQRTERAYIKLSHDEPGVVWDADKSSGKFRLSLQVKNFGRTPGQVTDVIANFLVVDKAMKFDELPESVRAAHIKKETSGFLVCNDYFFQHTSLSVTKDERAAIESGRLRLIIYACVDYIDQFNVRHRGGYGRLHVPALVENNLIFPDSGPFNYDRVRRRGEGIDWS